MNIISGVFLIILIIILIIKKIISKLLEPNTGLQLLPILHVGADEVVLFQLLTLRFNLFNYQKMTKLT